MAFGHSHGLGKELVDLLGSTVEPAAPEDLTIVGEGGGLSLAGEVDAQDESVRWNAKPTALAFVLLSAEPPGNKGARRGRGISSGTGRSV